MKKVSIATCEKKTRLHFVVNHTGKMSGLASLSTSPMLNIRCRERAKNPASICFHCFSETMSKRFSAHEKCNIRNTEILTSSILPLEDLPNVIPFECFRFEAFGDLQNETQVINYFNICNVNPSVNFALWTKNPDIIRNAILNGNVKPGNLNIVYSSPFTNKETNESIFVVFPFIDKVFTVYNSEYIENNGIKINCGSRDCNGCKLCYLKNNVRYINEKLK